MASDRSAPPNSLPPGDTQARYIVLKGCPYRILRAPYPDTSEAWKVLDQANLLLFFRYEGWLRTTNVWKYVDGQNKKRRALHLSRHTINDIPIRFLPWLLDGGHHVFLHPPESGVTDLASRLIYKFGKGLLAKTPLTQQRIRECVSMTITEPLIESAQHDLAGGVPSTLYVEIDAVQSLPQLLDSLKSRIEDRQNALVVKGVPEAHEIMGRWLATRPRKGPPFTPAKWAKYLRAWDLTHLPNPQKLKNVGADLFDSDDYDEQAKQAHAAVKAAEEIIRAAACGPWPPKFPRRGAVSSHSASS